MPRTNHATRHAFQTALLELAVVHQLLTESHGIYTYSKPSIVPSVILLLPDTTSVHLESQYADIIPFPIVHTCYIGMGKAFSIIDVWDYIVVGECSEVLVSRSLPTGADGSA